MSKIKPTGAELEVLQVLWQDGASTVRHVHSKLSETRDVFYTTTLKTMQVMLNKGMLERDDTTRSHTYTALLERNAVEWSLLDNLRNALFSGSMGQLIISALGQGKPSDEELAKIRAFIDKMDQDGHD